MTNLITIDKKYPECTGIDTVPWLDHVVGKPHDEWLAFLQQLNEQHNEEMRRDPNQDFFGYFCERSPYTNRWISDLQDEIGMYLRAKTGQVYVPAHDIDNVYNNETDFTDVFQYQVWVPIDEARWHEKTKQWFCDEWYYRDSTFVVTEMHMGGDVRGNYGVPEIRGAVDNLAETGFLDWVVGWYAMQYDAKSKAFEYDQDGDNLQAGYSSYPWGQVEEYCKWGPKWSESRDCFVAINKAGRFVELHPEYYVNGA